MFQQVSDVSNTELANTRISTGTNVSDHLFPGSFTNQETGTKAIICASSCLAAGVTRHSLLTAWTKRTASHQTPLL